MKFFFLFPPDPSTHIQKHSPYPYYLADLARKLQKNHSNTLKMDPQKAHLSVLTQNSVTKNPSPFLQNGKMGITQIPSTRSKPKKYILSATISKIQKTSKNLNLLIKIFLTLLRSPSCPMSKWSPYPHYIAQPSRKIPISIIQTSKMDHIQRHFLYIVAALTPLARVEKVSTKQQSRSKSKSQKDFPPKGPPAGCSTGTWSFLVFLRELFQELWKFQYIYMWPWPSTPLTTWHLAEKCDPKLQCLWPKGENVEWIEGVILRLSDERGRKWEKPRKFEKPQKTSIYL